MKRDVPPEHSGWTEPLPPLGDNAGECPKCQGNTTVWKTGTNRAELLIPYDKTAFIGRIRTEGKVFSEEYQEAGTLIDALVDVKLIKEAEQYSC